MPAHLTAADSDRHPAKGASTGSANQVLKLTAADAQTFVTPAGDVTGAPDASQVVDLTIASEAHGDVLYRNAANWVRLAAGTSGHVLTTMGASANPVWAIAASASFPHNVGTHIVDPVLQETTTGVFLSTDDSPGAEGLLLMPNNTRRAVHIGNPASTASIDASLFWNAGDGAAVQASMVLGGSTDNLTYTVPATGAHIFAGGDLNFTGVNLDFDPTGTFDLAMDAAQVCTINIATSLANSFLVQDTSGNDFIQCDTSAPDLILGGASNPGLQWIGTGDWTVGGGVGTSGQVLTSNGAALSPTWQAAGGGNTLNAAYDQGGAGAGRIVTVSDGAVELTRGTGDEADTTFSLDLSYGGVAFTGTPHGIRVDMSSATSLSNAGIIYGVLLTGKTNSGSGRSTGLRINAWDRALDSTDGEWAVGGGVGSSGQVLTSTGAGTSPTWQAGGGGGDMQNAYDADPAIILDATGVFPITHNSTVGTTHAAFSVTYPAAVGYTGAATPHAFVVDWGTATLASSADVYGLNMIGEANTDAGDSIGIRVDASWDTSAEFFGGVYFGDPDGESALFTYDATNNRLDISGTDGTFRGIAISSRNAGSPAIFLNADTGEDVAIEWGEGANARWAIGYDNSNNDTFHIIRNAWAGVLSNNILAIDTIDEEVVWGSPNQELSDFYFGSGKTDPVPRAAITLHATGGSVNTVSGSDLALAAGVTVSGGAGTGGSLFFQTALTDTLTTKLTITEAGVFQFVGADFNIVGTGDLQFTGNEIDLDPTGAFNVDMDTGNSVAFNVSDNKDPAFRIAVSSDIYLDVETLNGAERLAFGNAVTNPTYAFLGSGAATFTGNGVFNARLDINNGIALGGGAAPTLGTIGGSGPTAAAQSKWVEIDIGGTAHWIPVWV